MSCLSTFTVGEEVFKRATPYCCTVYTMYTVVFYGNSTDQITIKTPNPKCRLFLNVPVKGFICLRTPPLLGFVWGGKAIL